MMVKDSCIPPGVEGEDWQPGPQDAARSRRGQDGSPESVVHNEATLKRLMHELEVHQIELEQQNEELRRTHADVEAGLERYTDLYDYAPVGYLTLGRDGTIHQANHTAAHLLGVERSGLADRRFGLFVAADHLQEFNKFLGQVFASHTRLTCELAVLRPEGQPAWVQIEAILPENEANCRAAVFDIQSRKLAEIKLQYLSMHDALTGLYNRAYFDETMQRMEHGRHYPVSILVADVDHLKAVNDRDGHKAGDFLLQRAARVLTLAFRSEDIVARMGGDEFAVLLPETSAEAGKDALARFETILREHNTAYPAGPLEISCGMATAETGPALKKTFQVADARMYMEKRKKVTHFTAKGKPGPSPTLTNLRKQAEEVHSTRYPQEDLPGSETELRRLLYELQVHQIELEIQNEELRKAQVELDENMERYQLVADFTFDWETWIDPLGNYRYASLSCERITGYPPEAFIQNPAFLFSLVHPDDRETVRWHFDSNQHIDSQVSMVYRLITKDGRQIWIEHICQPVYGADGFYLGRRGTNRDITLRQQMEERLQRQTSLLEDSQRIAHLGSFEIDLGRNTVEWSKETFRIFGLDENGPAPSVEALTQIIHPEDVKTILDRYLDCIQTGTDFEQTFRALRAGGEIIKVSGIGKVVKDAAGTITGMVGTLQDITEAK